MNGPVDPEEPAASTDTAVDVPTSVVRQLHPRLAENPTRAAAGAPIARLSSYRRRDALGSRWQFTGRVEHVFGEQAERLRGDLTVLVRYLLAWASDHRDASDGSRSATELIETGLIEDGEAA